MKFSLPAIPVDKKRIEHLSSMVVNKSFILLAAALPFLAIPFSEGFVGDTKRTLLLLVGVIVLAAQGLRIFFDKSLKITLSPFCAALSAFGLTVLLSTFLTNRYPVESLLGMGGVYLAVTFIAGFGHSWITEHQERLFVTALGLGSAILAAATVLQVVGMGPSHVFNAMFGFDLPNSAVFNLAESPLVAAQVFAITGLGLIGLLLTKSHTEEKRLLSKSTQTLLLVATGIGLAATVFTFLPGRSEHPVILPLGASWSVSVDMMKSPRTALIGAGPHEFAHAFNVHKPININQTPFWNVDFAQGSNLPLTLLVTTGLAGFLSWLALAFFIVKRIFRTQGKVITPLNLMLLGGLALQLVLPPHPIMLAIFGLTLAYWLASFSDSYEQAKLYTLITRLSKRAHLPATTTTSYTTILSSVIGLVMVAAAAVGLFGLAKNVQAASYFQQSVVAIKKDDGVKLYELQQFGAKANPYLDVYRRRYAMTNLTVASALANKANPTELERQQIVQLVQQAIREARAATVLEPDDTRNWQTLGEVYTNMIGIANGADQWAISAYVRAIETSPTDPELRLAVGSIYYNQSQFDEAAQLFQQAVNLKPDHANAYYNLANALRESGKYSESVLAYQKVLELIDPASADYQRAYQELQTVQGLVGNSPASAPPVASEPIQPIEQPVPSAQPEPSPEPTSSPSASGSAETPSTQIDLSGGQSDL